MSTKKLTEEQNIGSILSTYYRPLSTKNITIDQLSTNCQKIGEVACLAERLPYASWSMKLRRNKSTFTLLVN